ncbi:hypothetical protein EB796_004639 [Bugula neritina]|uniref:Peptidase M14 domain-containing protein n=1 Tax=Bugula neritina TaxID=10212 RepID=A0A7J7KHF2_BUGNE|nr:hypothetical protein EB796_004639 [Bugula neritina]
MSRQRERQSTEGQQHFRSSRRVEKLCHPPSDGSLATEMASECGDRCTLINIGQSFEGREMKVIKITSNSSTGNKSAVFVEGGAHAREWISPVFVNNLIYKLIIEYGVDSSVTLMLDNYDWYILPLVNPDGYQYSHDSERYWRKNRATTIFRDCVGVDLNRNFPSFGMSDPVYSKHPCEDTYGGPFPGSEPETKNLVKFLLGVDKLHVFLSFHSYSKMILIPWSHKMKPTTHHSALKTAGMAAANAMEAANGGKWVVGLAGELLSYNAAGTSLDWAYANTEAKFVFTFEMPPSRSPPGFVLPESSIKSVVDTTWPGVTTLIKTIINTPALEDKYFVSKGSSKGKDMCYCEIIFMLLFTFCYI